MSRRDASFSRSLCSRQQTDSISTAHGAVLQKKDNRLLLAVGRHRVTQRNPPSPEPLISAQSHLPWPSIQVNYYLICVHF